MELTYRQVGDYRLPELTLPEEQPEIGKYGRMRKAYLKAHRKAYYSTLMTTGKLMTHLAEVEQTAQRRLAEITSAMEMQAGVTEELKATDQMKWVGLKNNILQAAEEQILPELIYN
ncbi:MAG: TnpV protein [Oscillospiraceae bacterium]|nr:TnpV protein [Oscillospiraceae bacterium]